MKLIISVMLTLFSISIAFAQQKIYRNFATQKVNERLAKADTTLRGKQGSVEFFIDGQKKKLTFNKITIPIVFHIIYAKGQEAPSEEQVYSQIEALNRDFSKKAYRIQHKADTLEGFAKSAEDMEIEFCLAKEGPSGKNEASIRFITVSPSQFTDNDMVKTERSGAAAWDTERYLNVWVAHLPDSISGYAQMPGGSKETDGIVIDYRYFGTIGTAKAPYNEGKTLTHLIGNYLGLYDLWDKKSPCGDDYVEDTPIHNAPNYNCEEYRHVSTCGDNPVEMTMNFMDNSPDACMYMFTLGQKIRMHAVLSEKGPRGKLNSTNIKCTSKLTEDELTLNMPVSSTTENLTPAQSIQVTLAPNPTSHEFKVQIQAELLVNKIAKLNVINSLGMLQYTRTIDVFNGIQDFMIDCRTWSTGIYYLTLQANDHLSTHRIVVAR